MLKPSFERLETSVNSSYTLRAFKEFIFTAPYHFHPEYELTLIIKGEGKRFVGNNMADFAAGDLVFIGANLPHCWKITHPTPNQLNAHSIVIQFHEDFLGPDFFNKPEFAGMARLLQQSANGLQITDETQQRVTDIMHQLINEHDNFKRLMGLLEILQVLANSNQFNFLNTDKLIARRSTTDQERINKVFAYIVDKFRQKICLDEAAAVANMSPTAFCKYFKKATRKTFMEMVLDYRINCAMQQLIHTNDPINQVAFDSGFTDTSQFYKIFRQKMNVSPLAYRKRFIS